MSDEYNVNLLIKQTKLIAKDINKHNKKYSGFKDLLKDNIPESLVDYNGNAYDISSVFHDTNWSSNDKTESEKSSQKFSQHESNANLELYKNVKLVPHEDASGTTHKLWTVYDDASNNLLEHMVDFSFDISGSYLPILTYYNGSAYVESTMFSDPLWWLIDYENHAISFFNTDSVLNGGTVNISASSANPPKLTFYRYIGKTKVNNKLSVEGDISCNEVIVSGTTLTNKLGIIDLSYSDLSGVVTANIASITSNTNNKAPKADPSFTGKVYIGTSNNEAHLNIQNSGNNDINNGAITVIPCIRLRDGSIDSGSTNLTIDVDRGGHVSSFIGHNYQYSYNTLNNASYIVPVESGGGNNGYNPSGILLGYFDLTAQGSTTGGEIGFVTGNRSDNESSINSKLKMIIRNNGNVGIGTTDPQEKLHIDGSILLNGFGNATTGIYFREGYGSSTTNKYNNSIFTYNHYGGSNTNDGISINGYDGVSICTGSNNRQERMIINQSGYVGIGTSSPKSYLTVYGNATKTVTGTALLQIGGNSYGSTHKQYLKMGSYDSGDSSTSFSWMQSFRQTTTNSGGYTPLSINSHGGNVGIGTDSPVGKLTIRSSAGLDFNIDTRSGFVSGLFGFGYKYITNNNTLSVINPNSNAYYNPCAIMFGYFDSFQATDPKSYSGIGFLVGDGDDGDKNPNQVLKMIITKNGDVGIGINTPTEKLHVSGNILATGTLTSSDYRIKKNITEASNNNSLQIMRDISCVQYEYIDKNERGSHTTIGFIAQQVKNHIPYAVKINSDIIPNEMRTLTDYSWNELFFDNNDNLMENMIYDESGNNITVIKYKLTIHDLSDNSGNTLYRFYVYNDPSGNDEEKIETVSMENEYNSFIFNKKWNNVHLYGYRINDFHRLNKNKLFTLNFSATQEIDRIQQLEQTKLAEAESEITTLKSTVETQQTTINTLQSTLAALEARIAALENP